MLRTITDKEVEQNKERCTYLHTSQWVLDVVTAILYDTKIGQHGCSENVARTKAFAILDRLGLEPLAKVNRECTPEGEKKAAIARGVLAMGMENSLVVSKGVL